MMKSIKRPLLRPLCLLLLIVWLAGCASHGELFRQIETEVAAQQPEQALQLLERLSESERDQTLYLINKGVLLHMQRDYAASIAAFEAAKEVVGALDAISVSEGLAAWSWAEGGRAYQPAYHERLLIHVYQALNHLQRNDLDAARVEALQIDLGLRRISQDGRAPDGGDAFARYLSGLIYEAGEEWSDAMIAYRKALAVYRDLGLEVPLSLRRSLLSVSARLSLDDEHASYREAFNAEPWAGGADQGELVLVIYNGRGPVLREASVMAQDVRDGRLYRVSLPQIQRRPARARGFVLQAGEQSARSEMVENVHGNAARALERLMPGLTARALARNVVKHNTSRRLQEENPLLGLAFNIIGFLAEQADTRNWRTMPDNIQLIRLPLPAGEYDLQLSAEGYAVRAPREYPAVRVEAGKKTFKAVHWIDS